MSEGVCFTGAIEHWNGSGWSFTSVGESLYGVDAIGSANIYAVGLGLGPAILHYDSSSWEQVPTPNPVPIGRLLAVDHGAGNLWAAGWRLRDGTPRTLAERAPSPTSGAVVGSTGLGNATVSWTGPESGSTASNQFGRYAVGGLTAGTYEFTATSPGCTPRSKDVTIVAGTTIVVGLQVLC